MRGASPERRDHRRGQSLVELAVSLTVMVLLVAGAVSFGMAYFSYVAIRDAAQEGALYASINPCIDLSAPPNGVCDPGEPVNLPGIRERIRASSTSPIDFSDPSVVPDSDITAQYQPDANSNCEGSTGGVPNAVEVTVNYDYQIFVPFVGAIIGRQDIPLTASATDTILEPRCP